MITAIDAMVLLGCAFMLYGCFRLMTASRRKWKVEKWQILEESIVSIPSNPDAVFDYAAMEQRMVDNHVFVRLMTARSLGRRSGPTTLSRLNANAFRRRIGLPEETVDE